MAVQVNFAQPVPDLVFKRALKSAEDAAFSSGLRSRHSIAISIPGGGVIPALQPQATSGRLYNALEEMPAGDQPVPAAVTEQLQITVSDITYRTWRYVSWRWQRDRVKSLVAAALSQTLDVVPIASVRLEYLDRFRFDGVPAEAEYTHLLRRDAKWLPPHIFEAGARWHAHTGKLLSSDAGVLRIAHVNVDVVDAQKSERWINIMTARENRPNLEAEHTLEGIFTDLDAMHDELIDLFRTLVTQQIADRIYLNGTPQ
ncbi:hypothetical protein [Bradyrhizobium sp. SZCCHNRI2049]|uniref:hypothetical protein n=1 Tax=Bradyrhizobium sp. SZCCHNRI2049 TaxID=3057287 RepID=UPI0029165FAA|nr:hypothetical protein [Bradyrhizobium sp. SZCCHNRI2049]